MFHIFINTGSPFDIKIIYTGVDIKTCITCYRICWSDHEDNKKSTFVSK